MRRVAKQTRVEKKKKEAENKQTNNGTNKKQK